MSTAAVSLEAAADLKPAGRAAIVFKKLPPGRFDEVVSEIRQLLQLEGQDGSLEVDDQSDRYGFDWLILRGADLQALLAALHGAAQGLIEQGLGEMLLAAVFAFERQDRRFYWIYNYKRGTFYPFAPNGDHLRDNSEELRLAALAKGELPVEPQLEFWYPLWDVPV